MTVKMPEPVAVIVSDYALFWAGSGPIAPLCERTGAKVGSQLITTTQAEAYKDACVREALEEAAQICWEMQSSPEFGKDDKDHWLAIAERRIRALIPPTE